MAHNVLIRCTHGDALIRQDWTLQGPSPLLDHLLDRVESIQRDHLPSFSTSSRCRWFMVSRCTSSRNHEDIFDRCSGRRNHWATSLLRPRSATHYFI